MHQPDTMTLIIKSTYSLHYYTLHLSYIHYSSVCRFELTRNTFNWSVFRSAVHQLTPMSTSAWLFSLSFFFFCVSSLLSENVPSIYRERGERERAIQKESTEQKMRKNQSNIEKKETQLRGGVSVSGSVPGNPEPIAAFTVKKNGILPNLKKRFGRWRKACKCVQSFKNGIKKSTEPLKDLTVCPTSDPFFFETFLSFVEKKKGFVAKIRNLLGFAINIMILYKTQCGTLRFNTKP